MRLSVAAASAISVTVLRAGRRGARRQGAAAMGSGLASTLTEPGRIHTFAIAVLAATSSHSLLVVGVDAGRGRRHGDRLLQLAQSAHHLGRLAALDEPSVRAGREARELRRESQTKPLRGERACLQTVEGRKGD